MTFVCVVVGVTVYAVKHINDEDESAADRVRREHDARRAASLQFSGLRSLGFALLTVAAFFAACTFTGLLVQIPGTSRQTGVLSVLGYVLYGVSFVSAVYFVASLTPTTRRKLVQAETFVKANALLALLLLMSVTYVPTIDYCVASYMCAEYKCPEGTVFNPRADRPEESFSRSESLYCDPCEFKDARCRVGGWAYAESPSPTSAGNDTNVTWSSSTSGVARTYEAMVAEYCPSFSSRRVWQFPEIACDDPALQYYYVSSGIVLVCYIVLVPILYVRLIYVITSVVHTKVQLVPQAPTDNLDYLPPPELYRRRVYTVEPAAASLYQPFTIHHKYFNITLLVFRLTLVALASIVAAFAAEGALYGLLALHVGAIIGLMYLRPFNENVEFVFAVALEGCSTANTAIGVAVFHGWEAPGYAMYALLGLNIVVPAVAAACTFRFVRERRKKKKREMVQAEEHQRAETDNDVEMLLTSYRSPLNNPPEADRQQQLLTVSSHVRQKGLHSLKIPLAVMPTAAEEQRMCSENDRLKAGLNQRTAEMVTMYFAALGMVLLIAGGASVLGFMKGSATAFLDGSSAAERGPMPVLGGFPSFHDMTLGCCCLESRHPAVAYNTTERWVCPTRGVTVDRGRVSFDGVDNGLPLRPVCGGPANVQFGCRITVNETSRGLETMLSCPPISDQEWQRVKVTPVARDRLF